MRGATRWGLVAIAALAMTLAGAGCASAPNTPQTYAALGGQAGVEGIVDDLLDAIAGDDRINFQFAETNIVRLREKLIEQICQQAGGPCTYTGDSMHDVHAGQPLPRGPAGDGCAGGGALESQSRSEGFLRPATLLAHAWTSPRWLQATNHRVPRAG